jgi:hypothetical protein
MTQALSGAPNARVSFLIPLLAVLHTRTSPQRNLPDNIQYGKGQAIHALAARPRVTFEIQDEQKLFGVQRLDVIGTIVNSARVHVKCQHTSYLLQGNANTADEPVDHSPCVHSPEDYRDRV